MAAPAPGDDGISPALPEFLSCAALIGLATWTAAEGARRSLATRQLLQENGDAQPSLDQRSALLMPVLSSGMLLVMYFLFRFIQWFLLLYMACASGAAAAFCLHYSLAQSWGRVQHWLPWLVRRSSAGAVATCLAVLLVAAWLLTSHWLVLDALGVCIAIAVVSFVHLPSLKVAVIVLTGLFLYDIFWVFFSSHFFGANVMVEVATRNADNPVQQMAEFAKVPVIRDAAAKLQLPIKLVFPASIQHGVRSFHMLGLGDIAIPGIFLAFALSFDRFLEKHEHKPEDAATVPPKRTITATNVGNGSSAVVSVDSSVSAAEGWPSTPPVRWPAYFHRARAGYVVGIVCSVVASQVYGVAQPALLYLVPAVVAPIVVRGHRKAHLRLLWAGFAQDEGDNECDDTSLAGTPTEHAGHVL